MDPEDRYRYLGAKVGVMVNGAMRHGTVVETHPAPDYGNPLVPERRLRYGAVRLWLDGEVQPEQQMRKPEEIGWA